ncbi:hypothetical protein [Crocosphaera sp. XPORK-15E]|uniref:hypothetical protein n=1 Tax=Crocosphaera sp. XPORK-15E TaxID=3110247 RepID=UPI002B20FE54|nr:hypothetical protein [Crocosphaera sp. XPORK-15E]MEA5532588.1 hypothetical protein [Crocosphaera sp. XPORK-15E]
MLQYRLPQITPLVIVFQGFMLWASFLSPNALANPSGTEIDKLSDLPVLNSQDNSSLTDQLDPNSPDSISGEKLVNKTVELQQVQANFSCPDFTPLTNTTKPNISSDDNKEIKIEPTSSCAADLMGVPNTQESVKKEPETSLIVQETVPELSPNISIKTVADDDQWHFKLQPYATVPINTYGTVSARGKTVSYHLSLGELLDTLRVTASGRFEGWKGRWGFIVDGYFASLQDIGNLSIERSRTPNPINTLNFLLNRSVNSKVQEVVNVLDREVQAARNIEELRDNGTFQNLDQRLQDFRGIVTEDVQRLRELESNLQAFKEIIVKDGQRLEVIALKVEDLQDIGLKIDELQELNLNNEELKRIISLRIKDLPILDDLEELNTKIKELNRLTDLRGLREKLTQTRDNLEQFGQQVRELRDKKEQLQQDKERLQQDREKLQQDKEQLQNLEAKIEEAKALLDREIQAIQKFEEFQANQEPQQLNADTRASLQFDQGIYDFALSYHIGDLPSHELPDQPSNRNFPLIWFQPIAGVRLNDISIDIETITNFQLSSSLVNIQGTVQQNFTRDRTWFEPLLGGKFGVQISDPVTFWLRGDASGFGLAGETDISWNLLFGVDWWVHRQISLQLGYRFYEIDYRNSSDNGDFGFEENLNGPFLSATFHF